MTVPGIPDLLVSHWELTPSIVVPIAGVMTLYLWGVRRVRGRWPARRTLAFSAGLASILVALESGLDAYDGILLSAHMVQHVILLLVAPLLILLGRPAVLLLRALPRRRRGRWGKAALRLGMLGHWAVGLTVFYAVVIVPHLPAVYDATLRHPLIHEFEHVAFLVGGLVFLWPLFGSPAGRHALGSIGSLCYVIASMPSCALVGSYLDRATTAVYAPYVRVDHALSISPVLDQQQAGAIMWVGAHVVLTGVALWVLGSKLLSEERRQQVRDALEDRSALEGPAGRATVS